MNIDESRWQNAWAFLSLGQIRALFSDLWIPIENPQEFQRELRKVTNPWFEDEKYYHERGAFNYDLTAWFHKYYGDRALIRLNNWVREIFYFDGTDRLPETVWSAISFRTQEVSMINYKVPKSVLDHMARVRREQQNKRAAFKTKLERSRNSVMSNWDNKIHAFQSTTVETTMNTTFLIGIANIFLLSWEKHCSKLGNDELSDLWKLGVSVVPHLQMKGMEIVFPGSWRFNLQQFIKR